MTEPLVSIIIPTYNRAALLQETLDSALEQTYRNIEIIVVDDGSTDDMRQVLSGYLDRVRLVCRANKGRSAARNTGIDASRGEFLVFLDSDDLLMPSKVQMQVDYLLAHPLVDVAYSDGYIMDEDRQLGSLEEFLVSFPASEQEEYARSLLFRNHFVIHAALVRRDALPRQPVFRESIGRFEDWDLWIRMCLAGARFAYTDEKMVVYRRHGGNTRMADVMDSRPAAAEIMLEVVRTHLDDGLPGDIRRDIRLYHIDLLMEYGTWSDVLKVIRDVVWGDSQFSLDGLQKLLFGRGPRPAASPAWVRSLPSVLARRWVDREQWQRLRSLRNRRLASGCDTPGYYC